MANGPDESDPLESEPRLPEFPEAVHASEGQSEPGHTEAVRTETRQFDSRSTESQTLAYDSFSGGNVTSRDTLTAATGPDEIDPQPLLPRFGMVWFFILVLIIALALFVIRAAEQAQALSAAMVFTVLFAFVTLALSGMSFLVAYLFGALEKAVEGEQQKVGSPFIDGSLPDQIVPPKPTDEI